MKLFFYLILFSTLIAPLADAFAILPASIIKDVVETVAKQEGKVLNATAQTRLEKSLTSLEAKFGKGIVDAVGYGGLNIIEQSAKYGDEVLEFCSKYPKASKSIIANKEEFIALSKRVGTDFLLLESRASGLAKIIIEEFGEDSLKYLSARDADEVAKLLYCAKQTAKSDKKFLFDSYIAVKDKNKFIEVLSAKRILASGIGVATITFAYKIGNGVEVLAKESPHLFALVFLGIGVFAVLIIWTRVKNLFPKQKEQKLPISKEE